MTWSSSAYPAETRTSVEIPVRFRLVGSSKSRWRCPVVGVRLPPRAGTCRSANSWSVREASCPFAPVTMIIAVQSPTVVLFSNYGDREPAAVLPTRRQFDVSDAHGGNHRPCRAGTVRAAGPPRLRAPRRSRPRGRQVVGPRDRRACERGAAFPAASARHRWNLSADADSDRAPAGTRRAGTSDRLPSRARTGRLPTHRDRRKPDPPREGTG